MEDTKNKYKLDVLERVALIRILPKEGNFISIKMTTDFSDLLNFDSKDLEKFGIKLFPNGTMNFDTSKNAEKEFIVDTPLKKIVVETLKELDDKSKLSPDLLSLYEKFIISSD